MTISYVWKVGELKIAPSKDGLSNVVQSVVWTLSAVDAGFSVETVFETFLNDPDLSKFVQFESLDEPTVLSWVQQSSDEALVEFLKANLRVLLEEKKNSANKTVSPPWKK